MDMVKKAMQQEVVNKTLGPPHWHDGLCDCFEDCPMVVQTIFCNPCTVSNVLAMRETLIPRFSCWHCVCYSGMTYLYGSLYPLVLSFTVRREVVQRYGIREESTCESCMKGSCCFLCTACQIQREMGKRNEHAHGCCAQPPPGSQPSLGEAIGNTVLRAVGTAVLNNGIHQPKPWSSGICQCSCSECVEGFFCPCCVHGYMASKIDATRVSGAPGNGSLDPGACCGALWFLPGFIMANRREVMERYNIIGEDHVMSACMVVCCPFCSILQQRREMGWGHEWPGGLIMDGPPPQVQPQPQMAYGIPAPSMGRV